MVAALRAALDALAADPGLRARVGFDPLEFPHRYRARADVEVVALIAASLAYGRAELFRPKVEWLLSRMGGSPAEYCASLKVERVARDVEGFVYRFNVATDVATLLMGIGGALRAHGALEPLMADAGQDGEGRELRDRVRRLLRGLLANVPRVQLQARLGPPRGLSHLFPTGAGGNPMKRHMLFLRWMVRGPDGIDLGLWRSLRPCDLIIPLDTHVARVSRLLGLTRRTDLTWNTAVEITARLRRVDDADPVRYDFALCHLGMSGECPARTASESCRRCRLRAVCPTGRAIRSRGSAGGFRSRGH